MRVKIVFGVVLLGLIASPAFAVRTILYYENECCRNITEGEFAILYSQGLRLREPAQGWTIQTAAAALSTLGHQPEGGWVLSRFVSEHVMAHLLRNSPFYRSPFTSQDFQKSDALVTVSQARSIFPPEEGITQGEFAVLLAQALQLKAPAAGWTPETATEALGRMSPPLRPATGWQPAKILKEWEMIQILAPTQFRATPIDPAAGISPLQAYSLLFGKFEIATEGHFGLFVVNALGLPAPSGGWTKPTALEYVAREFALKSRYGWNSDAPLCAEVFESALKEILARTDQTRRPAAPKPGYSPGSAAQSASRPGNQGARRGETTPPRQASAEEIIGDLRSSGLIPADRCAIIPAQGLVQLGPLDRPLGGGDVPPASTSAPPQ
jgi:hypothetical protein